MDPILLWLIAASMAVLTAWVLRRGSDAKTANQAIILLLVLSMMGCMFLSAVIYLYYPGFTNLLILVAFNMVTMSVFLIPALLTIFFGDRKLDDLIRGSPIKLRTMVVWAAIAFVFMAEVFMGWTLSAVSGGLQPAGDPGAVYLALVGSSSSYWFIFTMAAEMALTFVTMRGKFLNGMLWIVAVQPLMMFFSPTAIDNQGWATVSFLANAVIMAAVFAFILHLLRRNRSFSKGTVSYLLCLILAYTLMMTGLLIWFVDGDALVFVVSIYFEMTVYMYVILDGRTLGAHRPPGEASALPSSVPVTRGMETLVWPRFFESRGG